MRGRIAEYLLGEAGHGPLLKGTPRWVAFVVVGLIVAVLIGGGIFSSEAPVPAAAAREPAGPFELAQMERDFDANPIDAKAHYGTGPVLVNGTVSSVFEDRVALKTVFLLSVQAHFTGSLSGLRRGQAIRLYCDKLESFEIGGGSKPDLKGCSVIDVPQPAPGN